MERNEETGEMKDGRENRERESEREKKRENKYNYTIV